VREEIGQPFARSMMPAAAGLTPSEIFPSLVHLLPALLPAMWFCGTLVVLFARYARWRRISATVREALPLREGREVEACAGWSPLPEYGNRSGCYCRGPAWNLEFSA
jgi:hypothetical protein